ncbi:hypothetical protein PENANT_c029G10187 [Penicillium antarcticum]|uniref:BZIP domain-containing protein n=1 Tax=Penicillium antarcticum TaxID=416450 RepID=A0A1V6PVV2_9EURO|nr:uncharacterized protein N7508_001580 [Penicillium antarcticum]KAJ5317072.1 hypothetical protein N7508_001580 [Penicillium antarcticum]OQD81154.1 hypothetical protein PENANT_c029G10187 [Penicillium antarcticum]
MADRSDSLKRNQESRKKGHPQLKDKHQQATVSLKGLNQSSVANTTWKRREQLRTAQRAHRFRRKDTLHNLEKRVDKFETGIDDIIHTFFDLSKQLLDIKALENNPLLASALQQMTRECISLAEMAQMETVAT